MSTKLSANLDKIIRIGTLSLIIVYLFLKYPGFEPFPQMTATLMTWMLSFYFGSSASAVYDRNILLNQNGQYYGFLVSPECSGLFVMLVFLTVIFLIPGINLKHRFYSAIFLPLLFIVNAFRVASGIIFSSITSMQNLSLYHASIGQILMFVFMILFFMIFLKMFGYTKKNNSIDMKKDVKKLIKM